MTNTEINGVEVATEAEVVKNTTDIAAIQQQIAAALAHPSTDVDLSAALTAAQTAITALQAKQAADETVEQQHYDDINAKLAVLPTSPDAMLAAMTAALAKVVINVNVGSVTSTGGSGTGTGTGSGGTQTGDGTPAPVTPGSDGGIGGPDDKNTYPLTLTGPDADNNWTGGEGPDVVTIELGVLNNQERDCVVLINGKAVIAPKFAVINNAGMGVAGASVLVLKGPWGPRENIQVQINSAPPHGTDGMWVNGCTLNYSPLVYNGPSDYHGSILVNSPTVFIAGEFNLTFTQPIAVNAGPGAGSTTTTGPVSTQHALADAIAAAAPGSTLTTAPGVYNESVGIKVPLTLDGGGTIANPGLQNAAFTPGAILDATGVQQLVQNQAGFVVLSDGVTIKGWGVRGFGLNMTHDGTAGIRVNAENVTLNVQDFFITGDQMGIGPHPSGIIILKRGLLVDCGLVNDNGYAHNIYAEGKNLTLSQVTSLLNPRKGGGHAVKTRAQTLTVSDQNYFWASDGHTFDISDGLSEPFLIPAGTVIAKHAGDQNTVLLTYGAESINNGNFGGEYAGDFEIPDDGKQYIILTAGPINFTGRVLLPNGTPAQPGRIAVQAGVAGTVMGTVVGLP